MRMQTFFQKVLVLLAISVVCCSLAGCGQFRNNQSPQEQAEGYYWYEAVFLEREDVETAFMTVSDHFPKCVPSQQTGSCGAVVLLSKPGSVGMTSARGNEIYTGKLRSENEEMHARTL